MSTKNCSKLSNTVYISGLLYGQWIVENEI